MARITVFAALIAGAILAVPSAAQVGSGKIAYSAGSSGIVVVNPDGSGRTTLRQTGAVPVWSPDGTKLAGVRVTATGGQLFVINADGSDDHIVAESAPNSLIIGNQAWSPDGSRIAYVANNSLYTASAAGGDVRLVTSGAGLAPAWSPDGALAYSSGYAGSVYVIAPDGSGRARLSAGYFPVWAPSGDSIAFIHAAPGDSDSSVWLIQQDGSNLHKLAGIQAGGEPAWSPDGRQIAFTGVVGYSGSEVFGVNADGSNLRQLTRSIVAAGPSWSPDGDQMLFHHLRSNRLMRMNADGSCVDAVASPVSAEPLTGWSWQPLPSDPPIGERRCNAVGLDYEVTPANPFGTFKVVVTVHNEGTEALTDARLVAAAGNGVDLFVPTTSPLCDLLRRRVACSAHLERGGSYTVAIRVKPRRYSRDPRNRTLAKIGLHATASAALLVTGRETQEARAHVLTCSVQGKGHGRIDGTPFSDHVCGRTGRDLVHPGLGPDFVRAGSGNDVIFTAYDYWARDRIFCGPGRDLVVADRVDRVEKDCERVVRR